MVQHEGGETTGTAYSSQEKTNDETNVYARGVTERKRLEKEIKVGYKNGTIFGGVLTVIAALFLIE